MKKFLFGVVALATITLLGACAQHAQVITRKDAAATPLLPPQLYLPNYPLTVAARPTTSGESYLAHLQGRLQRNPSNAAQAVALAGVRYQRYQILGNLQDLDAAFAEAKLQASAAGASDEAKLLWATLAAYMHEFDDAERALNGLSPDKTAALRQEVAIARGKAKSDSQLPSALAEGREYADLVARAGHCVDQGDLFCATQNYHQAQFLYSDVAPLPLAWLHTQQGIALLRFGHAKEAIPFFEAALERVPNYYLAAEHRAECLGLVGRFEEARTQYLSVIEQTGNPEYMAGLAAMEKAAGNASAAQSWQEQAALGYQKRLALFPNAYAQHAVGFYLEAGELVRAHQLAEQNLKLRQDVGSYVLRAEVASAEHAQKDFCTAYVNAKASGLNPPELAALHADAARFSCADIAKK
jgi:tetratricopeptide (TPR) repeat protein